MDRSDVEEVMAGMAMVDDPVMEEAMPAASSISAGAMLASGEDVVAMGISDVAAMTVAGADTMEMVQSKMAEVAGQMGEASQVASGEFKDADAFHRGSGQAVIYSAPGGGHLLRLEDLNVTNGPALHVMLSTHEDPTSGDEVKLPGYADLGPLRGNRGNQNYTIPADVDVSAIRERGDLLQALLRRIQRGHADAWEPVAKPREESIVGRILYHRVPVPSRRSLERGG